MSPKSYQFMGPLELVVYIGGNDARVHRLPSAGTVSLGRDNHSDIEIQDTSVSRRHAILHIGSDLRLEDNRSRNGTEVYKPGRFSGTDTTIAHNPTHGASFDVEIGDRIKLGSVILVIRKAIFEQEKGTSGLRTWMEGPTVSDPQMEALYEDVREAAQTSISLSILIYGETGAGKESIARAVHDASPRKSRPFIAVNCAQFSQSLVEDALFGHVRGAFTGAHTDKKGYLQAADTGTLFLDEIADLPLETQVKLLRFLDQGEVYPIGSTKPDFVDVRVVAATNKNLLECVERGTFRKDLYYRLKGFEFEVPPLRKRPKDLVALAERFLSDACRRDNQPNALRLSDATIACLRNYPFPGNVRELKKAIEVAAVRCRGAIVQPEHLPSEISKVGSIPPPEPVSSPERFVDPNDERAVLLDVLHRHGGNQKAAAAELGICNRTLVNKLNRYPDIPRPKKKNHAQRPNSDLHSAQTTPSSGTQPYDNWPQGNY